MDELGHNTKEVWFVRHGQAEHNLTDDFELPDPSLTNYGVEQAKAVPGEEILSDALSRAPDRRAQLIITSPLRRTIQTSLNAFGNTNIPILPHPDIQETHAGERPCDTGTPTSGLAEEFATKQINFYDLDENWWDLTLDDCKESALHKRFDKFTRWLSKRPEDRIIVVAHKGVFKRMFTRVYKNCEVRKYLLTDQEYVEYQEPMSLETTVSMFFLTFSSIIFLFTLLINALNSQSRAYFG